MTQNIAELFPDKDDDDTYHVEYTPENGEKEVATFVGPASMERAMAFANSYYDDWRGIPKSART